MSERFELCDKCSAATGRCGQADDSLYAGDFGPYCEDCWENLREDLAADVAALEARAKEDAIQHLADIGQLHERIAALEAENKALRDEQDAARNAVNRLGRAMGVVPGVAQCFDDVVDEAIKRLSARAALAETAHCCVCGVLVDTRAIEDGGDTEGCQLSDGSWVCSSECWDVAQ